LLGTVGCFALLGVPELIGSQTSELGKGVLLVVERFAASIVA